MRPFGPQIARYFPKSVASPPATTASYQTSIRSRNMSSDNKGELKIESQNVKTAAGVELSAEQKTIVGSVLDLFAGRPSLAKLQLWKDDGEFIDPLTIAKGRKQYEAQWYGLQSAFSEIERLSHEVTDSGNPIKMDMSTRYKVKGIGKEQKIDSKILIYTEGGQITRVEDRWDGKLPESNITQVSWSQLTSPVWWLHYGEAWAFWTWSLTWNTPIWRAFQRLNAVTVPAFVGVPKNTEEDAKRGNQ